VTELSEKSRLSDHSPAAMRRREAKSRAHECFHTRGNCLTMIAAILIPMIMFMSLQGLYAMVYIALPETALANADMIATVVMLILTLPLLGGTMYIAQGLADGEERHARDVFHAYTSPSAYLRAWIVTLLPLCILALTALVDVLIIDVTHAMCNIVSDSEKWSIYIDLFLSAGDVFIAITTLVGVFFSGYLFPIAWLAYTAPGMSLSRVIRTSIRAARGHLGDILIFHLSFLGWLILSICTVGILLVLFVLPYYLLTAAFYISALCRDAADREAKNGL